ncbi:endo-1,4-beta-xylanase [Aureimonas ureilytica]|uniref:endo-1,4-beta-xylanase n=1 Tax=Aureimonas ureilytica TaxID=401562 RepID=UPI00036EF104|nr:endo-1,4-beta-xylanase [Aureimonas ureilytica]
MPCDREGGAGRERGERESAGREAAPGRGASGTAGLPAPAAPLALSRRHLLLGAGALFTLPTEPARAPERASLRAAAARGGRRFGAAARSEEIAAEPDLAEALLAECDALTPEISLKWDAIEPEPGRRDFARTDALLRFAAEHGRALHGHTLIWHRSVPAWAEAALADGAGWAPVAAHFEAVLSRYGAAIETWDVVNEPIDTGHRMDGLRGGTFLQAFGETYVERAFHEARAHAPNARLFLNEYGLDYDIPVESDRRYLFLKLVERLMRAGAPLGGIGLQGHLDLRKGPFSDGVFDRFLREIAGFGLEIHITELDVRERELSAPPAVRDRLVAEITKRYLDVALDCPSVRAVTTWGLSTRHSWLAIEPEDLEFYWRLVGEAGPGPGFNRGLPYDSDMRPAPMREAILSAFERRPLGI